MGEQMMAAVSVLAVITTFIALVALACVLIGFIFRMLDRAIHSLTAVIDGELPQVIYSESVRRLKEKREARRATRGEQQ